MSKRDRYTWVGEKRRWAALTHNYSYRQSMWPVENPHERLENWKPARKYFAQHASAEDYEFIKSAVTEKFLINLRLKEDEEHAVIIERLRKLLNKYNESLWIKEN